MYYHVLSKQFPVDEYVAISILFVKTSTAENNFGTGHSPWVTPGGITAV